MILELSLRDLKRIYYVDLLVSKYYQTSLYSFCTKYKYDEFFLYIIKKVTDNDYYDKMGRLEINIDSDALIDKYYKVESKFSYGSDNRGVIERVVSLGVNWVVEDIIVHKSSSVFILTGCDNTRDLLINNINSTPDIRYVGKGESYYVEVCSDFTTFMVKNRRYDLRKLKYCKLEDLLLIEKKKTILLFIDVVNKKYYRTWFRPKSYEYHNKYGYNTISYEFDSEVEFKELDKLFEGCKLCQLNPSLYSNFNVVSEVKKPTNNKCYDDSLDDGYWDSLLKSEPAYIKKGIIDSDMGMEKDEESTESDLDSGFEVLPDNTWTPFSGSEDSGYTPIDNPFGEQDSPF